MIKQDFKECDFSVVEQYSLREKGLNYITTTVNDLFTIGFIVSMLETKFRDYKSDEYYSVVTESHFGSARKCFESENFFVVVYDVVSISYKKS